MMRVIVAAWVLMTTVTMTECQGQNCTPAPGTKTISQPVRRFPTAEACRQAQQQVEQTISLQPTTIRQGDLAQGQSTVLRQAMTWSCQPE